MVDEFPSDTAYVKNIELLFPEWTIVGEPWNEGWTDTDGLSRYPQHLGVHTEKSIKSLFGLEETSNEKGNKKTPAAKKGSLIPSSAESDDTGKPLPKIFTADKASDYDSYRWSHRISSDNDCDADMAAVLNIAMRFVPALCIKQTDGNQDYLWKAIYPKSQNTDSKSERSCYNPSGRYCVRLFFAGKWRKVYVNDMIPVHEDGSWALTRSSDQYELWPMLLSKAVYSAYHTCK
jgi:hypothetical protein